MIRTLIHLTDRKWLKENKIIKKYNELIETKLDLIHEKTIYTSSKLKSEKLVKRYFQNQGYTVIDGTVHGYRVIGFPDYWEIIKTPERRTLEIIQSILPSKDFDVLSKLVANKNGCPDLMIIKNKKIKFVEVKSNNEIVKPVTVEFFIKLKEKYPISIVRVIRKKK